MDPSANPIGTDQIGSTVWFGGGSLPGVDLRCPDMALVTMIPIASPVWQAC